MHWDVQVIGICYQDQVISANFSEITEVYDSR
jgi:hypothetical protein